MQIRCLCILLVISATPAAAWAREAPTSHVLLVYPQEREMATFASLDRELRSTLEDGTAGNVQFFTEYLDLIRFQDAEHLKQSLLYLRFKYATRGLDLIVLVGGLAFDFLVEHAETLFPGVPVVFTSVSADRVEHTRLPANMTGIAARRDIRRSLDLALSLHPDTRRIVIPAGTSATEQRWTAAMRGLLRPYETRVEISYLAGLPMSAMLKRLEHLPEHTLVLLTPIFLYDADQRYFLPEESTQLIASRANVPVYGTDAIYLGRGIVGGVLLDTGPLGAAAGRTAVRILHGEPPGRIPVDIIDPNYPMFDERQLRRWAVPRSALPLGSVIRYHEPGVWEQYRGYVIAAVALSVLQAALIVGLIANIANRRRAAAALRTSYAHIRDLAGRLITAQEAEGARIARELHDDVGQRLASLSIAVSAIKRQLTFAGSADVRHELSALQQDTVRLSNDLRLLSHQLHPGVLTHLGLVEALRARCDEIRAESGIPVAVEASPELGAVSDDVSLCLYRVAQEALRNVVKHADARTANVSLARQNGHIVMHVSDDGRGFDANHGRGRLGVGLMSLEERVRMLQGTLAIDSSRATGTRVSVTIPVGEDHGKTASAAGR